MTTKSKKSRRHQKLTLGRTRVSRYARRVRRTFFNRQMEVEALRDTKAPAEEITRAVARLATVEEQFRKLPKLAKRLEVPAARAAAELDDDAGDDE